ncbi:MAG: hypothetical protein ACREGI_05665 [Candidatus Levyibacteriota bacterium]
MNWEEIKAEYFADPTLTFEQLAQMHGGSGVLIAKRAEEEHWFEKAARAKFAVEENAFKELIEKENKTKEEINKQTDMFARLLLGRAIDALLKKYQDGNPKHEPKTLTEIKNTVKVALRLLKMSVIQ